MAVSAAATAPQLDPARQRGLRRSRRLSPCPEVAATPLPAAPSAVEVLALLTRVRSVKVAIGELDETRLYDLRAFKTCWAELAYLHRLAAGGRHGGTVVTSMRQLVAGIAPLHPAWKLTGDSWEDRDRHHQSVRRRLSALAAAGLLVWRVGVDEDLEERRTELQLKPVPELLPDELEAAAERLERWKARYNTALNSGSHTGILDVRKQAAPLSASERQRRGCRRARQRAQSRRVSRRSQTNSSPPFGAPPLAISLTETPASEKNNLELPRNAAEIRNASSSRTRVTRIKAKETSKVNATVKVTETAAPRTAEPTSGAGTIDSAKLLERVRARREARTSVVDLIGEQALQRAVEVAHWPLDRLWPAGRLREAWVVWREGSSMAGEQGAAAAGRLEASDLEVLRRAAARYERYSAARPEGFPEGGLAALAQIATIAGERDALPVRVAYGIRGLDQLSRRMRAAATCRDLERREHQAARARKRRTPPPTAAHHRDRARAWPAWVSLDEHGDPILIDGQLQIQPGVWPTLVPARHDRRYLDVLRDAYLLAGLWPPTSGDGRYAMAARNQRSVNLTGHAIAGPYHPPTERPDPADRELARRASIPLHQAARLDHEDRDELLNQLRREQARRGASERAELWQRIDEA